MTNLMQLYDDVLLLVLYLLPLQTVVGLRQLCRRLKALCEYRCLNIKHLKILTPDTLFEDPFLHFDQTSPNVILLRSPSLYAHETNRPLPSLTHLAWLPKLFPNTRRLTLNCDYAHGYLLDKWHKNLQSLNVGSLGFERNGVRTMDSVEQMLASIAGMTQLKSFGCASKFFVNYQGDLALIFGRLESLMICHLTWKFEKLCMLSTDLKRLIIIGHIGGGGTIKRSPIHRQLLKLANRNKMTEVHITKPPRDGKQFLYQQLNSFEYLTHIDLSVYVS